MTMELWLVLCVAAGTVVATYDLGVGYAITVDQRNALANDIQSAIYAVREPDEDGNLFYPFVAGFVRLAFHQCVSGKCIGCINLEDANNLHLSRYVDALEAVRRRNPFIRYGDLWAMAGIVALQVGEHLANNKYGRSLTYTSRLQFRYGREDCTTAPYTTSVYTFPSFSKGLNHILTYFSTYFGLTETEVVALLGAHKLGGLRSPSSAQIINQWTNYPDILDNSYYVAMSDSVQNWHQSSHALNSRTTPVYFWTNGLNKRLMFNTDMCLYKDLKFVSGDGGEASCSFGSCQLSKTAYLVSLYAASNDAWLSAFIPAYMKMTERGYSAGALKSPANVAAAPPPKPFCILWIICF